MSPQFLAIAYYTKQTKYQTLSENLKHSTQIFSIPLHIKEIPDLGSWERNTHYKAEFILESLNTLNQDLLYVDVDAVFREYPKLLETLDCDIAYRTENFKWRKNEALSGTIFIKNTTASRNLLERWIELNKKNPAHRYKPETWEQANMQRAVEQTPGIKYYNLPPEYTFIFDHTKNMYPGLSPVIEHFQASRKTDI